MKAFIPSLMATDVNQIAHGIEELKTEKEKSKTRCGALDRLRGKVGGHARAAQ